MPAGGRSLRLGKKEAALRARKGSRRLAAPEAAPDAAHEALDRLELRLVRHLRALADPVAQVQVRQAKAPALLDLPHHVIGAEARAAPVGLVEGVDRRQAIGQEVDDRD